MLDKLYRVTTMCTAVFAVLCCIIMVVFLKNAAYFDSHGKMGNLAELEKIAYEQEYGRKEGQKKNIAISIQDRHEQVLCVPLQTQLDMSQVAVREEFTKNKLVITLKDAPQAVAEQSELVSDSAYMRAIGLYTQQDNIVLEIYCNAAYAYECTIQDGILRLHFDELAAKYEKTAVVYVPMKDKSRLASEEWKNGLKAAAEEKKCKVWICSDLQEDYTAEDIVVFANKQHADCLVALDVEQTSEPSQIQMICNPTYFIPEFGSIDLGVMFGSFLQKNTLLPVTEMNACEEENMIIAMATIPACEAKISVQSSPKETIEEEYAFHHSIMEAISSTITTVISEE